MQSSLLTGTVLNRQWENDNDDTSVAIAISAHLEVLIYNQGLHTVFALHC